MNRKRRGDGRGRSRFAAERLVAPARRAGQELVERWRSRGTLRSEDACHAAWGGPEIALDGFQGVEAAREAVLGALRTSVGELDPCWAQIALLRVVEDFYGRPLEVRVGRMGPAAKNALALVCQGAATGGRRGDISPSMLQLAVELGYLLEELEYVGKAYSFEPTALVTVSGSGLVGDQQFIRAKGHLEHAAANGMVIHRTGGAMLREILEGPEGFAARVMRRRKADEASTPGGESGPLFDRIPGLEVEFWDQVLAYSLVLQQVWRGGPVQSVLAADAQFVSTAVLRRRCAEFGPGVVKGLDSLRWDVDWAEERFPVWVSNLVVERPLLPVPWSAKHVLTTTQAVVDGLGWFVEAAVAHSYPVEFGRVSDATRQRVVTDTFEGRAAEVLYEWGFSTASVTEKGGWKDGVALPGWELEGRPPGEIDLIAMHPSERFILVLECKVLSVPTGMRRMYAHKLKLGERDSSEFHLKLARKLEWVRSQCPEGDWEVQGAILVDRMSPVFSTRAQHPVIDLEHLERVLDKCGLQCRDMWSRAVRRAIGWFPAGW